MRKTACAVVVSLLAAAACFAQTPAILLQNQDSSTFYYLVDPPALEGIRPGSPLLAPKVAAFFSATDGPSFSSIEPDHDARLTDLSVGPHLLVGFFAVMEEEEFPVRVITLQVDSTIGDRFYAIFASPAQLTVSRGTGKLAGFGRETTVAAQPTQGAGAAPAEVAAAPATASAPRTDARAPLESIKDFTASFDPVTFTREKLGSFSVAPIEQSRAWDMTGTRITAIAGARDPRGVRLSLTVPSGFSPNVSYFLYAFSERTLGRENGSTLELIPRARGQRAACLLWRAGDAHARIIGTAATMGTVMEVELSAEELREIIPPGEDGEVTFDLTAGWHDANLGLWEEFYYTSFVLSRIAFTR